MPTVKLTERSVAKMKAPDPSGRQVLHWDSELKGFGVLCSGVTSTKTYIVQRALPGGRTRRVTIASVAEISLQEAREKAARVLLDLRAGLDPKAGTRGAGGTLRRALESYLEARHALAERSKWSYRDLVTRHLAPWLDRPLRTITPDEVEKRHQDISKAVRAASRGSGHATANAAMRAFRVLWNYAADRDATLPASPTRRLKRQWFKVPPRERCVRTEELPRFYAAVCDLPNKIARDFLLLLLFTGMRRREAAGLRWKENVDIAQRVIKLPAAKTKSGRKLDIPMSDVVLGVFMERQRVGRDKFVFPANGGSGHIEEPKFPLKLVAKACGVQVSAHDLRRTYVTVAESADISPIALRALVNHSLGKDVTSGYVQMTAERLREPAQRVADKLRELCGFARPKGVARLR